MTVQTTAPAAVSAPPEVRSLRLFDADALAEAVRGSRFEHVQVERGVFLAELKRVDIGDLNVNSGCYTRKVIARGDFPPGSIVLGCVLDSREEGYINGYRFNRNDVVIFPQGAELDYVQPAATRWCAIALSETLLKEAGCQEMRIDKTKVMPGYWPVTRLMERLLNGDSPDSTGGVACSTPRPPPGKAVVLDQIREVLHHYRDDLKVRRPSLQNRMAMVRQFEHQVRERIHEVLRIPELCSELGVSQRVLEYVFKEEIGMTPKQFCEVLRLNAFRHELLRRNTENQTITQIAGCCGISHLGRLSAAYLRQFGELPSATIRR